MVQIRIDSSLRDTENPEAFDKIFFSFTGNDNFIEHIFITDIFQPVRRVMDGKVGVLGIHPQIVFRGTAGKNFSL